jgi:hypothetical protein
MHSTEPNGPNNTTQVFEKVKPKVTYDFIPQGSVEYQDRG